ncbi:MAG: Zn-ribbon domain-containing OB-fold protein [Rhodospirillaceae bacterium]|nr:Zn-ribbon domain-containing OB-fold protein [Rhodospirillaceae bacterium]MBT6608711.1 Zn-ribbon domain-containing OB-fold protein [Rhodospirillaceae bacterium]MBT7251177.1 Zn-ribbon domain-containing OB-fold protein [Rhodospirillaceae bacterium]MBT7512065.1 Zn-ribbon domain-containing OB-fold protein [Rhodospirillaceae bacterium]
MENSRRDLGPLPGPDINADARTYWAAAAEERLVVQCCDECGIYRFYPRPLCPDCASDQATWTEVSGQGSVHTFTIVHRAPNKEFQAITPYVIALIDLDEGPRMMANILGNDAIEVAIGDRVRVIFEERDGGARVPQFVRAGD